MIKIMPTTESGLTHSDYTVTLPAELDIHVARSQKIANTLAGVPVVTLWAKSRVGASQNLTVTISKAQYKVLKTMVYHATVFEWLVLADDERYVCSVDLTLSKTVSRSGSYDWKECNIAFVIIEVN